MLEKFEGYGLKVNPLVRRCETAAEILRFYRDIESKRADWAGSDEKRTERIGDPWDYSPWYNS